MTKPALAAYLDPSTGSYLIQFLVAGVLGGLFTLKMYWTNFKAAIYGLLSRKRDNAK